LLASAHADGKADILVMPPGDVAKRLERVSQLSTAVREAALATPREDDEEEGAHRAPTPLAPGRVNAFDFMPGDPGLAATMNGYLGKPGARGAPLLSEMTTFFFAAPRTRRLILTLEAGLADEKASLLVWIDGRPADLFPARALAAQAAKVHALRNDATAPLTVGLEIVGGRQAGLFGHLRALGLHTVRGGA